MSIYKTHYGLSFTKIYWSRLKPIRISRETNRYVCLCCRKTPHLCEYDKESAIEYGKIQQLFEWEDAFGVSSYDVPIKQTGYLRADQHAGANIIWKTQRELANAAGFTMARSSFW